MGFSPRYVRDYFAQSKLKTVLIWIVEIALVILLAAGVSSFFCRSIVVQEGSMEPTLKAGDRALINSAAYKLSSPRRGDIVVFRAADDAKSRIFDKFYQVDGSHKAEGNGLGLALVKRIVDIAGGTIKAENREYGGCRFVVELPIKNYNE